MFFWGEVRVGCKVDKEKVEDELDDLDSCDPFFPPDADSTSGLEVVPVHDDVDHQIESNWNVTLRGSSDIVDGILRVAYHRGVSN